MGASLVNCRKSSKAHNRPKGLLLLAFSSFFSSIRIRVKAVNNFQAALFQNKSPRSNQSLEDGTSIARNWWTKENKNAGPINMNTKKKYNIYGKLGLVEVSHQMMKYLLSIN